MNGLGKNSLALLLSAALLGGCAAAAEEPSPALPDNPAPQVDSLPVPGNNEDPNAARQVTWKNVPVGFLKDQEGIWLRFPGQVATGHHWVPLLAVSGITAGLIMSDRHEMPYFRTHARNWDDFNDTFDAPITTGEVILVPVGVLAAGMARHDDYMVGTALLAGQAYADSAMVDLAIKAITHRQRPEEAEADFRNTWFNGATSPLKGSSFPSGHSAGAFSVATVIAGRYGRAHKWVPPLMYTFATVISLSRITDSSHFPSDVFLGAALGYTVTKYQTLRPQ